METFQWIITKGSSQNIPDLYNVKVKIWIVMAGSDDILVSGFYQLEIVDKVHFLNDLSWLMTYELFL